MTEAFEQAYLARFSFLMPDKPIVVEAVSVEAVSVEAGSAEAGAAGSPAVTPGPAAVTSGPAAGASRAARSPAEPHESAVDAAIATPTALSYLREGGASAPEAVERVRMFAAGEWATVPLYRRAALVPGQAVDGPAIIAEDLATTVVEPGWRAAVTAASDLLLTRFAARPVPPGRRRCRAGKPSRRGRRGRGRGRERSRPGAARGVLQPVHGGGRADGGAAAVHRALRQHQGTARLLLRDLRRRRQPHRERPAHPGSPRLDERIHKNGDRSQQRDASSRAMSTRSTTPTTAAPTSPTSR